MRRLSVADTGIEVTNVCLGSARFGTSIDEETTFSIIDRYVEFGGNFLDTAHIYAAWLPGGKGSSETTIGRWLQKTRMREAMVIGTKCAHPDLDSMEKPRMRQEQMRRDLAESLDRLQVDCVDILWLHRDDPGVPIPDILGCLNEFHETGSVTAFGASNWSPTRIAEAASYAAANNLRSFSASQVAFSLAVPNPGFDRTGTIFLDDEARRYHQQSGLFLAAYSSQAKGFFSGKYQRDGPPLPTEGGAGVGGAYCSETNFDRLERAQELSLRMGRSANEIALAYLFSQSFDVAAIVGSRTPDQVAASCGATDLTLSDKQISFLEGNSSAP